MNGTMQVPGKGLMLPPQYKPQQPPHSGKIHGIRILHGQPTVAVTSMSMSQMTRHHICLGYPGQLHGISLRPKYRLPRGRNMLRPPTALVRPTRLLRVEGVELNITMRIHGLKTMDVRGNLIQHAPRRISSQYSPLKKMHLWNRRGRK